MTQLCPPSQDNLQLVAALARIALSCEDVSTFWRGALGTIGTALSSYCAYGVLFVPGRADQSELWLAGPVPSETEDAIRMALTAFVALREMEFAEDGTPAAGESAGAVTVPFSNYKTGTFTYDPEQQLYLVEEYGEPYIDGDTGEQVGVTNLVVVQTACRNTGDSLGHITVDLSGSGEGYFACGGKIVPITWSKQAPDGQLYYYGPDGAPLTFGTGRTYVCIIPLDREVTWAP